MTENPWIEELEAQGFRVINVSDEAHYLDGLTAVDSLHLARSYERSPWPSGRERRRPFQVLSGKVGHIVTPEPVSKRRARRLRGRHLTGPSA